MNGSGCFAKRHAMRIRRVLLGKEPAVVVMIAVSKNTYQDFLMDSYNLLQSNLAPHKLKPRKIISSQLVAQLELKKNLFDFSNETLQK